MDEEEGHAAPRSDLSQHVSPPSCAHEGQATPARKRLARVARVLHRHAHLSNTGCPFLLLSPYPCTMDDADPALQFFAEGEVDLYGALGVSKEATADEIKRAYRKQALKYHPDKLALSNGGGSSSSTSAGGGSGGEPSVGSKFQQIGFAYSVLSTESRRSRYDSTGRTDESMFDEGMDWNAYFKEMWSGEVSAKTLEAFKKKYRHSQEERQDLLKGYEASKGSLPDIVDHVPFLSLREDRRRIETTIEEAIKAKEIKRLKKWDSTRKDERLLDKAEKKESREEEEAKEMAREMGVYDALFGSDSQAKPSKKRKGGSKEGGTDAAGGDDEYGALQNIIAQRNKQRGSQIDGLIAKLEADAGKAKGAKAAKGDNRSKRGQQDTTIDEPSDEQFERIRARLDANKGKKRKT